MFSRVLVATDLSEASQQVANCVGCLRAWGSREAVLVHCLNLRDVGTLAETIEALIRPQLEQQRSALEKQGYAASAEIALGLPQIEINRLAAERECSLIVVGSQGHTLGGLVAERLFGGVASAVIHSALKPVLIIRLSVHREHGRERYEAASCNILDHILFPTDFSDNAELAFSYLERLVQAGAHRVTLLHVQDKAKIGKYLESRLEEFNQIDNERLERLKRQLVEKGATDVAIQIPYGYPISEILKRTREAGVSLVVMGSQGRDFISEIFLGSVSHNVARQAPTHVLLVPMPRL